MGKIDRVLKELSELYDFNRKLKAYTLKEEANRVDGGFSPPASTTPGMRVRTGRFTETTEPEPGNEGSPTARSRTEAPEP